MGFLKKKIKKYDYKPRYYKGEGNPYKIEHKFDLHRTTVGKNKGLKAKFSTAFDDLKNSDENSKKINNTVILIVVILVLLFLFFIDFDLSIFTK